MSTRSRALAQGFVSCHVCKLVCAASDMRCSTPCPRCNAELHSRKPHSLTRAWALLLAGVFFYIPANLMPVMYTQMVGGSSESTIFQGILEFWQAGSYGIALVIFIASVAVPCAKFLALAVLLVTTQHGSHWAQRERARLYRLVELIGYWSMLDVLVVAIVAALVKFHSVADIEPRIGILFFGSVVLLTMLSAMQFDPRLIWDSEKP